MKHEVPERIVDIDYANHHGERVRATKHGAHGSPEYISWQSMLTRCYNPNAENYARYGALCITVCERWRGERWRGERWRGERGFINFLADMGPRPPGTTIDRINPHGDYEPGNCRWATDEVQRADERSA